MGHMFIEISNIFLLVTAGQTWADRCNWPAFLGLLQLSTTVLGGGVSQSFSIFRFYTQSSWRIRTREPSYMPAYAAFFAFFPEFNCSRICSSLSQNAQSIAPPGPTRRLRNIN